MWGCCNQPRPPNYQPQGSILQARPHTGHERRIWGVGLGTMLSKQTSQSVCHCNSAVVSHHKNLKLTVFIQHKYVSWTFMWARMFFWTEKARGCHPTDPEEVLSMRSGMIRKASWQTSGTPEQANLHCCLVPHPPSFHPFLILPMGLHIFSPSWYVSCELSRKFRKFLRRWTEDKLRFVLSFLEILQLHFLLPEDPGCSCPVPAVT